MSSPASTRLSLNFPHAYAYCPAASTHDCKNAPTYPHDVACVNVSFAVFSNMAGLGNVSFDSHFISLSATTLYTNCWLECNSLCSSIDHPCRDIDIRHGIRPIVQHVGCQDEPDFNLAFHAWQNYGGSCDHMVWARGERDGMTKGEDT